MNYYAAVRTPFLKKDFPEGTHEGEWGGEREMPHI